jgi:hypothetical protein
VPPAIDLAVRVLGADVTILAEREYEFRPGSQSCCRCCLTWLSRTIIMQPQVYIARQCSGTSIGSLSLSIVSQATFATKSSGSSWKLLASSASTTSPK